MPIYFLCTLVISPRILKQIERIQRQCLWRGNSNTPRQSLAAWDLVCLPNNKGGLGVLNLKVQNEALLMKFLHKFYNHHDIPWVSLIWIPTMIALSLILPAFVGPFGGVMCLNWHTNTVSWLLQCWGMAGLFSFGLIVGWSSLRVPPSVKSFPGSFHLLLMDNFQCLRCSPRSSSHLCVCLCPPKHLMRWNVCNKWWMLMLALRIMIHGYGLSIRGASDPNLFMCMCTKTLLLILFSTGFGNLHALWKLKCLGGWC